MSIFDKNYKCLILHFFDIHPFTHVLNGYAVHVNCVCALKAWFKQINDALAYLRILMTNGEPCLLREICLKQRHPFLLMQLKALV